MTYEIIDNKIIITSDYHCATLNIKEGSTADEQAQAWIAKYSRTEEEKLQVAKNEKIDELKKKFILRGINTEIEKVRIATKIEDIEVIDLPALQEVKKG